MDWAKTKLEEEEEDFGSWRRKKILEAGGGRRVWWICGEGSLWWIDGKEIVCVICKYKKIIIIIILLKYNLNINKEIYFDSNIFPCNYFHHFANKGGWTILFLIVKDR